MSPDLWQVLMISKLPWWWDPREQDVGKDIWANYRNNFHFIMAVCFFMLCSLVLPSNVL